MKKIDKKEQELLEDINNYLIDLTFHISNKMFPSAKGDLKHIKKDIKKLDNLGLQAQQLGLTKKEFKLTRRIPQISNNQSLTKTKKVVDISK